MLLQGAGLVDELTTCWAMISLKRCAELVRDMTISVPLYTGSIYDPVRKLIQDGLAACDSFWLTLVWRSVE
jgi:hypothetical protein